MNERVDEKMRPLYDLDRISKAVTHFSFRNGPVEDMHADGKLTEEDMKTLNKFMVNSLAYVFDLVLNQHWAEFYHLLVCHEGCGSQWDPAKMDDQGNVKWFFARILRAIKQTGGPAARQAVRRRMNSRSSQMKVGGQRFPIHRTRKPSSSPDTDQRWSDLFWDIDGAASWAPRTESKTDSNDSG